LQYPSSAPSSRFTCQALSGAEYTHNLELDLRTGEIEENIVRDVRLELSQILKARDKLWLQNPKSNIIIRVVTLPEDNLPEKYGLTVFCNKNALALNQLYLVIETWALFHGFPIILKNVFDVAEASNPTSWFTILSPSYMSLSDDYVTKQHPIFVMRDYPEEYKKWGLEPCISWGEGRPNIGNDFFLNLEKTIGVSLSLQIREASALTTKELGVILKFIFHGFAVVEILSVKSAGKCIKHFLRCPEIDKHTVLF